MGRGLGQSPRIIRTQGSFPITTEIRNLTAGFTHEFCYRAKTSCSRVRARGLQYSIGNRSGL